MYTAITATEAYSGTEQETMLQEFYEFDRKLIHEKYTKTIAEMENNKWFWARVKQRQIGETLNIRGWS